MQHAYPTNHIYSETYTEWNNNFDRLVQVSKLCFTVVCSIKMLDGEGGVLNCFDSLKNTHGGISLTTLFPTQFGDISLHIIKHQIPTK